MNEVATIAVMAAFFLGMWIGYIITKSAQHDDQDDDDDDDFDDVDQADKKATAKRKKILSRRDDF